MSSSATAKRPRCRVR